MNNNSTFKNFMWRFFERCGAQIVSLCVTIVIARLIEPEVFGSIAIITVVITIVEVFVDGGLGAALIQKKDADDLDFSSVFYFKLISSIILYVVLFFLSPVISGFYKDNSLIPVLRVLGISILVAGIKNVEQAYVSRHLMFKAFFYSTLIGTIASAIVGIIMALNGFGVWALVAQNLTNSIIDTIVLWIVVKWRPIRSFSFKRVKVLAKFGIGVFLVDIMDVLYENVRQLIIGKKYTSSDLAFYNRGKQIPSLVVVNLTSSLDSVLLPTMSNVQERIEEVKKIERKSIVVGSFLIMPMMFGLCACASPFIQILLTEKWSFAVFFMQVFCLSFAFYPINSSFKNSIKAIGKSNVFFITELIKKALGVGIIICTVFINTKAMAVGVFVGSVLNIIVNIIPNIKYLRYSFKEQMVDILPPLALSLFMFVGIYFVNYLNISDWKKMLIMVINGAIAYLSLSKIFKFDGFFYYFGIAKKLFFKNRLKK